MPLITRESCENVTDALFSAVEMKDKKDVYTDEGTSVCVCVCVRLLYVQWSLQ